VSGRRTQPLHVYGHHVADRMVAARGAGQSKGWGEVGHAPARRWVVLVAGTVALTAGSAFQYGLAYLIPALRAHGLSLQQAGVLVACPTGGLLLALVAWGATADKFGERLVLAAGLAGAGVLLLVAAGGAGDGRAGGVPGLGRGGRSIGLRRERTAHPQLVRGP
jgi:hypothetical protein